MDMQTRDARSIRPATVVAGVILLLAGTAMFLDAADIVDVHVGRLIGPLVLITLGAGMSNCRGGGGGIVPRTQVRRRGEW